MRILKFFNHEFRNIHKAAIVLAISSIGSSSLALLRDRLLADHFGAGKTLDIYYVAFRIPDFLYVIMLSITSVAVIIPFFLERMSVSKEKTYAFFSGIFSLFIISNFILVIILFLFTPYLIRFIVPGFAASDQNQLTYITRILLLSPFLLGLSNLFSSIIQSYKKFFIYALSPILYNLGIIIGILFFSYDLGLKGVVFGVILGAAMHLLIQVPEIIRLGFMPRFSFSINFSEIKEIAKLSLPRTLGLGLNQFVFIFIIGTASFLAAGSIAVFTFSYNIQYVILGVVGFSYSVAAFPTLTKFFVKNQRKEFLDIVVSASRHIIFWTLPATALFVVLRAQIVRVILGSGEFSWSDTRLTAAGLALFAISLTAQSLVVLFVRSFYAAGKTRRPLIINIYSSVFIVISSYVLIKIFNMYDPMRNFFEVALRVKDVPGTSVLMLPLAFSLGMIINAVFLWESFQKEFNHVGAFLKKTLWQSIVSALLIGVVAYFGLSIFDDIFNLNTFIGIFLQGLFSGLIAILAGCILLKFLKNQEMNDIISSLKQKFWK
ncbi:MAG: lipid II flippase MurJ, partial [Patescibacteria group bacterium]